MDILSNYHGYSGIFFIWSLILLYFLYKCVRQLFRSPFDSIVVKQMNTEGLPPESKLKYLLMPIFTKPSADFDLKDSKITVQVLYERHPELKEQTKLTSFTLECSKAEVSRSFFCLADYRWFVWFERKTPLPPITHIQAVHNSKPGETIVLEGIEVFFPTDGQTFFYSMSEPIENKELKDVRGVPVKRPPIFSLETFCPTFYCPSFETYGDSVNHPNSKRPVRVMKIQPKLNWFETLVLMAWLMSTIYLILIAIWFGFTWNKFPELRLILSVVGSSGAGLLVTEMVAYFYRRLFKEQYNTKQTTGWTVLLVISMAAILTLSVVSSIAPVVIMAQIDSKEKGKVKKDLDVLGLNTEIAILLLLVIALVIAFTFGLLLFGIFRLIYRSFITDPNPAPNPADIEKTISVRPMTEMSDNTTEGSEASTTSDKVVKRKDSGENLPEIKQVTEVAKEKTEIESSRQKRSKKSAKKKKTLPTRPKPKTPERRGKKLSFHTERLEKELADKEKKKRLMTDSVIASPTDSKGFENPENFRLTHSKIDREMNS